jgi:hypothetical protein
MIGPVSIFAIAEMNQRAAAATKQVRAELFRIGCAPAGIQVRQQGVYLQMRYRRQVLLADPEQVLAALEKMPVGLADAEVWQRVAGEGRRGQGYRRPGIVWTVAALAIIVVSTVFVILLTGP